MKTIIHDNKLFEEIETNFYSTWREKIINEETPRLSWKKGRISLDQWEEIKNICEFTNDKHSSECLIRLYFNAELDKWTTLMHPQTMNGMTVNDTLDTDLVLSLGNGWAEAGSVHHHCGSGAFQSGTDHSDEMQASGLHITLGKIGSDEYEIDARFREGVSFTEPRLSSFFELPEYLHQIPNKFQYEVFKYLLCSKGNGDLARADWITKCIEKPVISSSYYGQTHYRYNGYGKPSVPNNYTVHKLPDADSKDIETLTEDEEAELIENNWSDKHREMYEVCEHLSLDYDVSCMDILNLIDEPEAQTEDALILAWNDIRNTVKDCTFNLTELRKFVNESIDDIDLVLKNCRDNYPHLGGFYQ